MSGLAQQIRRLGNEGDLEAMSVLDRQFHYRMIQASRNQILARLTEAYRVLGMFVRAHRDMGEVHHEHEQLVAAIEANRPDEAESLARRHVQVARRSIERQVAEGTFVLHPVGGAEDGFLPAAAPAAPAASLRGKTRRRKKKRNTA